MTLADWYYEFGASDEEATIAEDAAMACPGCEPGWDEKGLSLAVEGHALGTTVAVQCNDCGMRGPLTVVTDGEDMALEEAVKLWRALPREVTP